MCGKPTQYRRIHNFMNVLRMPGVWRSNFGDQPLLPVQRRIGGKRFGALSR